MRSFTFALMVVVPALAFGDASIVGRPAQAPDDAELLFRKALKLIEEADFYEVQSTSEARAELWRLEAIKLLLQLVDDPKFASYARRDEAVFTLARELVRVHKGQDGRKYFKRLLMEFPKSRFIPDTFVVFGDYYFAQSAPKDALKFYEKVIEFGPTRVHDYAVYKAGWCAFNMGDYKQALSRFADAATTATDEKVRREARRDLVSAYARIGEPAKAKPFFRRIAGGEVDGLLDRLADAYRDSGRPDACRALGRARPCD